MIFQVQAYNVECLTIFKKMKATKTLFFMLLEFGNLYLTHEMNDLPYISWISHQNHLRQIMKCISWFYMEPGLQLFRFKKYDKAEREFLNVIKLPKK